MPWIDISRELAVEVDECDYDFLQLRKWSKVGPIQARYAMNKGEYLHRVIVERKYGLPIPKGLCVDHINRNTADNRRENLRLVTVSENLKNRRGWVRRDKRDKMDD